ncbi:RcpC/CpaB family pilus assembly protein [Iamia majanohamensis]|uniref:RcpC/CpaB family pilus assembly protein n=1 Tax=Iamia majanohamensis TaxID=467976 RepID=A0AAE9YD83_9ACTN|nr:RcpC/CpaB family pilus assembly protein [Iamia majanohamensis]WCO69063.1 RcpC/CpaB family pilus assembly protein [Iamia majanohamensis]
MGSRRTLITIAAIAVGAIAVVLIYGYVGSVKDEAFGEAERVKVYVVKTTVPQGTYGEEAEQQKLIVEDEIPKKFFPPNAIRSMDDIGGKVAVAELAVNQIVTTDMFADPSVVQSTFSDRLEKINDEDQVAVTISVDQIRGVAGLLQPGDFVNVMTTDLCENGGVAGGGGGAEGEAPAEGDPAADPCEGQENILFGKQARYVYQKVQVLAIGQTPVAVPGDVETAAEGEAGAEPAAPEGNTGLITLIVPAKGAQYVASLPPENIYLSLVSRDYEPVPQTPIDPSEPLPAEDPSELTPYGPNGPGGE